MTLSPSHGYPRPHTPKPSWEPLHILVARQRGRLLSFRVSGSLLIIAAVFSLLFIGAGLWGINLSLSITGRNWDLEDENQGLRHELAMKNAQLAKLKRNQAVVFTQPTFSGLIPKDNPQVEVDAQPDAGPATVKPLEPEPEPEPPLVPDGPPPEPAKAAGATILETLAAALPGQPADNVPELEIVNSNVKLNGRHLTVSFTLQVQAPGGQAVQGSTWVWVELEEDGQYHFLSHPPMELDPGQSIKYRRGDPFSIRNNKTVQVVFEPIPGGAKVDKVMALVWSERGQLWVKSFLPLGG